VAPSVEVGASEDSVYRRGAKRLLDLLLVLSAAPLVAPLALVVAALVRVRLGSPVLYRQPRPGLGGRLFTIVKFRTMSDVRGSDGGLLPDSERLGRFGRLLRATSLDEVPEFWNVLMGDMSLVGPRPLLVEYLPLYKEKQARRHEVRPGITGWAQVNGRNALTWEQKFEMDVWYVENVSFGLDVRILWKTLVAVVRREGISAAGDATMPRFTGSAS
jgi:lipopolysaccharide/colanic/teichoic acid biosynthesis glycosyltransferase